MWCYSHPLEGKVSTRLMFVSGAALGAGMGLILAPREGYKMRRVIRRKASQARLRAEKLGNGISKSVYRVRAKIGKPRTYFRWAARVICA